jgi:hypothetical protein
LRAQNIISSVEEIIIAAKQPGARRIDHVIDPSKHVTILAQTSPPVKIDNGHMVDCRTTKAGLFKKLKVWYYMSQSKGVAGQNGELTTAQAP